MIIPIIKDVQMQHIHFDPPEIKSSHKFADRVICDAIINYAREQGYTDLSIIDEEFIKSALIHEIRRKRNTEEGK